MTLDTVNIEMEVFMNFFGDFELQSAFQKRIAQKSI